MLVKDVMVATPVFCRPTTNLAAAVEMLWNANCGILPILKEDGKLMGVVTDRDIAIALGTRNRLPAEIAVNEVTLGKVFYAMPDHDIHTALEIMQKNRVRRLPVIGKDGMLRGILSLDDIAYHAEHRTEKKAPELSYEDLAKTYKAIVGHRAPELSKRASMTA